MAIFDLTNFGYRSVIKLAPDSFMTINGAFGGRIISAINKESAQTVDIQGGIVSINTNSAVSPPAAGRANIHIVAPEYTGLQTRSTSNSSGYWVTLPSGVKVPYFIPMMEVQVFMKGRYLYASDNNSPPNPVYYRTFWGFITEITEDYSSGLSTFNLQCQDMLGWWRYQKLTVSPNEFTGIFNVGNVAAGKFPTIFKNKNPWQIITQLLYETQFLSPDGQATYNFVSPKLSSTAIPPYIGTLSNKTIGAMALEMSKYWQTRFNFFNESMQIEMFGMTKKMDNAAIDNIVSTITKGVDIADSKKYNQMVDPDISLDYNLLARVQPFGDFNLYSMGAESLELTKLDVAQKVCEQAQMEFYVDLNGIIVFKPPFYNMDVTKGDVPYYVVDSKDVISYSSSTDTDHICTFLELTAPRYQQTPNTVEIIGFHIDWELMLRYGMRYQRGFCQYGNDAKSLSLIAAAEIARINAEATTGHVSIPLRPEIRMGYPVYITHKDVYYYITGISHNFSFGSSATTDLTLTAKRERIYDATGELTKNLPLNYAGLSSSTVGASTETSSIGRVVRGFVQKYKEYTGSDDDKITALKYNIDVIAKKDFADQNALFQAGFNDPSYVKISNAKEDNLRVTQAKVGPKVNGFYELVPAEVTTSLSDTVQNTSTSNASGAQSTVVSNQLLMITDTTIPYTDIKGYRHIGAFPYGANLVMRNNTTQSTNGSPKEVSQEMASATIQETNSQASNPAPMGPVISNTASTGPLVNAAPYNPYVPYSTYASSTVGATEAMIAETGGTQSLRKVILSSTLLNVP